MTVKKVLFTVFIVLFGLGSFAEASPFDVPEGLRPRVDFWIGVFARYGRAHIIVHHRMFPQVIFGVVDLTEEASGMGPIQFERLYKQEEKAAVEAVRNALRHLASGEVPENQLQARVQQRMKMIPGSIPEKYLQALNDDLVRSQTGIKEKFAEAIIRSGRHIQLMERIFRDEGLPIELTRLPFIESSFDYTVRSSVGAVGLWQFMQRTGKSYMTVNQIVDERKDPLIATRAAARYLKAAYNRLGAWPLAVTSYNHGVAGVAKKVTQMGTSDIVEICEHPTLRPFGFASTNFYPELLAAIEVYRERAKYFPNIRLDPPLSFREIRLNRPTGIFQIARAYGVSLEALQKVNYALANTIWSGRVPVPVYYSMRIPAGGAIVPNEDRPPADVVTPDVSSVHDSTLVHIVRKGERLRDIAVHYNTTEAQLRILNDLKTSTVMPGQKLIVKSAEPALQSQITQSQRTTPKSPTSNVRTHTVRKGETLSSIARKYGVPVESIKRANGLKSTALKLGRVLAIPSKNISIISEKAPLAPQKSSVSKPDVVKGKIVARKNKKSYVIRKGDTISSIAKQFGVSESAILKANGMKKPNIRAGKTLILP